MTMLLDGGDRVAFLTRLTKSSNLTLRAQAEAELLKVGPKGYEHNWVFVGVPGVGAIVHHPEHGRGTVTRSGKKTAAARFDSGHEASFEHGGTGTGHFAQRGAKKPTKPAKPAKPAATKPIEPGGLTNADILDAPRPTIPPGAFGRTRTAGGSIVSTRLPARSLRIDDTVYDPDNHRRTGRVLAIYPDRTMRIGWNDGHTEVRPIETTHDPHPDPRRWFPTEPPVPAHRMDERLGGPPTRRTGRQRLADSVAAGRLDSGTAARLISGESPTSIADSRTREGFRDYQHSKLPAKSQAALDRLDAGRLELYWLRRATGQDHAEAFTGVKGLGKSAVPDLELVHRAFGYVWQARQHLLAKTA